MPPTCSSCGFVNPPGMRFCGNCGARLAVEAPLVGTAEDTRPRRLMEAGSQARLGALIGADLKERFRAAGLQAAGQRRDVTILFVDLAGFTDLAQRVDPEDLYELIQQFIRLLVEDVYKYEGMVDKLIGDGLMALFGAPISHENNAERAVRSAIDMLSDVARLNAEMRQSLPFDLRVHIGLNAGTVIVGGVGSDLLMNYTAIGDTVNLAQRLMEAASPGTLLVSESVFRVTRLLVDYQPLPGLVLKGYNQLVTAYRYLQLNPKPGSVRGLEGLHAPMVGREAELARLLEVMRALVEQRRGQLVLVTGEAGIGKSRLTAELKARLRQETGLTWLEGFSLTYRRAVPYWIFQDLLRRYLGITPESPPQQVLAALEMRLVERLGAQAAEARPYLEYLLGVQQSDPASASRLDYLDASQLRQQIFLAVRELLAAEARRQPLMLILEDLHWADDASLDLLAFLVDLVRQVPLLIYAITRPFQSGPLAKLNEHAQRFLAGHFTSVHLGGLSPGESERLLYELLAIPELPSEFLAQVLQRAAGIPFYLEEILRMLIDDQVIQRGEAGWQLVPGKLVADLGVPGNLQGLILARFDRLNPFQRQVLQAASVVGRHFPLALLAAILRPAQTAELQQAVDQLVERAFLTIYPSQGSEDQYAFRHVLTSDAVYSTLLRKDRNEMHGAVGEAIEKIYADHLEAQIEVLAGHFLRSPRLDRALHYLILAGEKTARDYVNAQARFHYEQALALLPRLPHQPEQALQVHMGLGDVLLFVGEYAAARQQFQAGLHTLAVHGAGRFIRDCSDLQRRIAATYERQGDFEQALEFLQQARQTLRRSGGATGELFAVENARILNDIGWIDFRRGELDQAESCLGSALALVENTSQYDVVASIYNRLAGVYYQKDELVKATNYLRKSLGLREAIGDIIAVARSYNNLGLLGWKSGDWDSALENFQRSVELHAAFGDVEGMIDLHSNLGLLLLDRGQIAEARQHFDEALTSAQQIGHSYHLGLIYLYYTRLFTSIEDWPAAQESNERSLAIFQELGVQDHLVDNLTYSGLAWLGQGNLEQARLCGQRALETFERLGIGKQPAQAEDRGRALRLLGEVARLNGDHDQSAAYLEESLAIFNNIGDQLEGARTRVTLAALAQERGDPMRARRLRDEARLVFHQLSAALDLRKLK
jgi:class 3 adenylate cyclase/tetratricopeptide (TPR) repeat protein